MDTTPAETGTYQEEIPDDLQGDIEDTMQDADMCDGGVSDEEQNDACDEPQEPEPFDMSIVLEDTPASGAGTPIPEPLEPVPVQSASHAKKSAKRPKPTVPEITLTDCDVSNEEVLVADTDASIDESSDDSGNEHRHSEPRRSVRERRPPPISTRDLARAELKVLLKSRKKTSVAKRKRGSKVYEVEINSEESDRSFAQDTGSEPEFDPNNHNSDIDDADSVEADVRPDYVAFRQTCEALERGWALFSEEERVSNAYTFFAAANNIKTTAIKDLKGTPAELPAVFKQTADLELYFDSMFSSIQDVVLATVMLELGSAWSYAPEKAHTSILNAVEKRVADAELRGERFRGKAKSASRRRAGVAPVGKSHAVNEKPPKRRKKSSSTAQHEDEEGSGEEEGDGPAITMDTAGAENLALYSDVEAF